MSICDDMAAALDRAKRERAGKRDIGLTNHGGEGWVFLVGNLHAFAADMRFRFGDQIALDSYLGWPVEQGPLPGVDIVWRNRG